MRYKKLPGFFLFNSLFWSFHSIWNEKNSIEEITGVFLQLSIYKTARYANCRVLKPASNDLVPFCGSSRSSPLIQGKENKASNLRDFHSLTWTQPWPYQSSKLGEEGWGHCTGKPSSSYLRHWEQVFLNPKGRKESDTNASKSITQGLLKKKKK